MFTQKHTKTVLEHQLWKLKTSHRTNPLVLIGGRVRVCICSAIHSKVTQVSDMSGHRLTGAVPYRDGSVVAAGVPAVRPVLPARRVPPVCVRWLSAPRAGSPPPASRTGSRHRSAARAACSRPSFSGSSPAGRIHGTHGASHIACCIISALKCHSVSVLYFIRAEIHQNPQGEKIYLESHTV